MPAFESRGFPIHYELHEPRKPTGRLPLLLVMGMGGTCQGWAAVTVPDLVKDRPVLIYDQRGAGQSGWDGARFALEDMLDDVRALLDHVGLPRVHVGGGFLGGLIAQELAARDPERVQGLVLLGSFARLDAKRRAIVELWRELVQGGVERELRMKVRLIFTLGDFTMEQADLIERMKGFYTRDEPPVPDAVFVNQAEICCAYDGRESLPSIVAPTLIVAGEEDILTPPHLQRELASLIKERRLVLLPGAGHLVAAELAPRFNRLVSRFLARNEPA